MFELVDLGEVGQELAVERHALVGEFVVGPVLFDDFIDHLQHDVLFVVGASEQVMVLALLAIGRLFHEHDDILEEGVFVLAVDVKDGLFFGEVAGKGEDLDGLNV